MKSALNYRKIALGLVLPLTMALLAANCKQEDDDSGLFGLALLAAASQSTPIYAGFADVPASISATATNTGTSAFSTSTQALDVSGNSVLEPITAVYNPVRSSIKLNRDIVFSVGELVQALKGFDPAGQVVESTTTWSGQAAKIKYQADTTFGEGGRKLEVWWNNAPAPYGSLKAFEIVFRDLNSGNESTQDINGVAWGRFLQGDNATLGIAHVDFDYTASTGLKTLAVILQGTNVTGTTDNAHFYVRVENGITTMDGTITAKAYTENVSNSTSSRAYVFAAAGSDTLGRAVVKAAFPLSTSTDTADATVYGTGQLSSFSEIYTDWILSNSTAFSTLTSTGLGACTSLSAPSSSNPTSTSGSTAAQLQSCLDAVNAANAGAANSFYYITQIQNSGYYTYGNGVATLQAVGSAPTGDTSYDTVSAQLLSGIRTTGSADYAADFTPNAVSNLDITAGTNIPAAARWTTDDTAPF